MGFQPLLVWGALGELLGEMLQTGGLPAQALVSLCAWTQQRDGVPIVSVMKDSPVCPLTGSLGVSEEPSHDSVQGEPAFCVGPV